jgi:uncharacterized protein YifE (UPF0438 family)
VDALPDLPSLKHGEITVQESDLLERKEWCVGFLDLWKVDDLWNEEQDFPFSLLNGLQCESHFEEESLTATPGEEERGARLSLYLFTESL